MALSSGSLPLVRTPGATTSGSARFDAAVVLAALWFVGGLLVDGWAHNNLDLSREGFFTPYHALFYSGFVAIAAVILTRTARNRRGARTFFAAIPRGYDFTLAGLGVFAVGGVLDMTWHLVFGIEQDIAALFSPTHLVLATGIALILTGPIRGTLARNPARSFAAQWPALVALALFATLVTFFMMWAFGISAVRAAAPSVTFPQLSGDALATMTNDRLTHGISSVVLRSLVMVGVVIWAARRFALPRGAATLLLVVPSTLVGTMLEPAAPFVALQFLSALAGGIVADVALARGLDLRAGSWRTRSFAFAIAFAFWVVYMAVGAPLGGGYWWNAHIIAGAPVIGGLAAVLLELVTEGPRSQALPT